MMRENDLTDDDLNSLFAAARAEPARPSAVLTARVLGDADAHLARLPVTTAPQGQTRRPEPVGLWSRLGAIFGGGGALAGMLSATIAGFWIGFAQPLELGAMAGVLGGTSAEIDMMPGLDALLDEAP